MDAGLDIRIRPPRMLEVQVLQEQKTCHAADGLSKVPPVYVSRYYLWDSPDCYYCTGELHA
jgi:hypothetical protein